MKRLALEGTYETHAQFARAGVIALSSAIGSDLTTLSVCNLRTGRRRVLSDPPNALSNADIAAFNRYFHSHPLVRYHAAHQDGGAHRISDSLPTRAFRRTPLYGEYYQRIGIAHAIAVPLHVDDRTLVSFVLNRTHRDFNDRERADLDIVRTPLALAYRHVTLLADARRTIARYRQWVETEGWAEVNVRKGFKILAASRRGCALLAAVCPGARPRVGGALPTAIEDWLRCAARGSRAFASSRLPEGAPVVALHAMRGAMGKWLLYLREDADACRRETLDNELPLTPREHEILHWVASGKSDAQVASIVGASVRTVQKHLEHVYAKLGVESRTAAAMRIVRAALR